ncbi:PP2C domain-containing protein [Rhizoctonia solani AG-1 IA]|uniref:Protein phosphatase n=1 Tax=Thanatephorus cucumeris (strain AG1-IA) TaxID=983506 RepID=L8WWU2_THACA|nr:PP2C domain-containing protein [Rhizoctonia solani AG-1 IA]
MSGLAGLICCGCGPELGTGWMMMNQHIKTAVVKRARSLYTASALPQTYLPNIMFDYSHSPRPSPRKVPYQQPTGQSQQSEQPSGSPATTLPAPYYTSQTAWIGNASQTPTYSIPPPLWLCPPLDAACFPLALGIDVGPGPWDLIRVGREPVVRKEPEVDVVPWTFECGAYGIPKKPLGKRKSESEDLHMAVQVGEDSYFVRPDALGVADGVGGWAHHHLRADSARFARMLMHNCANEIANPRRPQDAYPSPPLTPRSPSTDNDLSHLASVLESVSLEPEISPRDVLHLAYERTVATFRATGIAGSSTALVAILRDGELSVAHLGDCMLAVVRDGKFVLRSEDMQHSVSRSIWVIIYRTSSPRVPPLLFSVRPYQSTDLSFSSSTFLTNWARTRLLPHAPTPSSSNPRLSPATLSSSPRTAWATIYGTKKSCPKSPASSSLKSSAETKT